MIVPKILYFNKSGPWGAPYEQFQGITKLIAVEKLFGRHADTATAQ